MSVKALGGRLVVVAEPDDVEVKKLPKRQKCARCKKPATKRVLWAEGMAYQPACDTHLDAVKADLAAKNGGSVDGVKDIPPVDATPGNGTATKALPFGGKRGKFVEGQHPRDRHGRFIEVGGTVSVFGGGTAEVLKTVAGGRIEIRSDKDGKVRVVDAGLTTQIRTAAQNANRAGRLDPNALHQAAIAGTHPEPHSHPDPKDPAGDVGGHVAGAAHDEVSGGPAEAPKGPPGTTHAPDADPRGAISHLRTPDGAQAAWLHHDPAGGEPIGHVRTDTNDPNTTHRFDNSQQWAAHADQQGMEETDQVPPAPGQDPGSDVHDPDPGTAGEAETVPGEPQPGTATGDQVAQFLSDGLDHQVTAYREAGGDMKDKPDSATQDETEKAAKQAKVAVAADLTERMAHVPDEDILAPADLAQLGRLNDGSSVLLRMPYHIAHPGARERPLFDPENPNPGEELGNWDYREVPTSRFDQLMASGHQLPGATERVSAEQWGGWKRNERISNAVALWATQSNGTNPHALALQETAQDLFGIDQAADWGAFNDFPDLRDQVDAVKEANRPFNEAFLLAQYDATQDRFAEAGVTHVQLFRGFRTYDDSPEWMQEDGVSEVPLRPMSSFSSDEKVAGSFARDINGDEGVVISATVPVTRIIGTPRTGSGSLSEQEFVVLGGPGQFNVRHTSDADGPAPDHNWDPLGWGPEDVFYDENGDPIDVDGNPLHGGGSPTTPSVATTPAALLATRDELQHAIQAADTPERRAELVDRAGKLGMTDLVPDTWHADGTQGDDPNALPTEKGPDGKMVPLTPEQLAAHTAHVEDAIRQAKADGLETDKMYSLDGKGKVWDPERAKLHNEIVDEVWATAGNVPDEGKGLFSGGMGGSGKTTTLNNPKTGIDQSQYLTINPDDIKEIMAAKGMIPETPNAPDLSPMEKVALIHEESSHIAGMLALRAYAEKKNVTWDITMASESSVQKRIDAMHAAGYTELKAVFVDIPVEGSVARAMGRYTAGLERYRNGVGAGGRYVPPDVIRENASTSFSSANRQNFESLRDQFDNWQVWDNSVDGRQPRLVYAKGDPNLDVLTSQAKLGKTDADQGAEAKALPGTAAALDRLRRLARAS